MAAALAVALAPACASSSNTVDSMEEVDDGEDAAMVRVTLLEEFGAPPEVYDEVLASEFGAVRSHAMMAVARLHHQSAMPQLVRGLNDDSAAVREAAAYGLARLLRHSSSRRQQHQKLRQELVATLQKKLASASTPKMRRLLLQGLASSADPDALRAVLDAAEAGDDEALRALVAFFPRDDGFTPRLVASARKAVSKPGPQRRWGLLLLSELADPPSADVVADLVESGPSVDERLALLQLAARAPLDVDPALFEVWLRDPVAEVRAAALVAVRKAFHADVSVDPLLVEKSFKDSASAYMRGDDAMATAVVEGCEAVAVAEPDRALFLTDRVADAVLQKRERGAAVGCLCAVVRASLDDDNDAMQTCQQQAEHMQRVYFGARALGRQPLPDKRLAERWAELLGPRSPDEQALMMQQVQAPTAGPYTRDVLQHTLANQRTAAAIASSIDAIYRLSFEGDVAQVPLLSLTSELPSAMSSAASFSAWRAVAAAVGHVGPGERAALQRKIIQAAPAVADRFRGVAVFERELPPLNVQALLDEEEVRLERIDDGELPPPLPSTMTLDTGAGALTIQLHAHLAPRTLRHLQQQLSTSKGRLSLTQVRDGVAYFHAEPHGLGGAMLTHVDESSATPLTRGVVVLTAFDPHRHTAVFAVMLREQASVLSPGTVIGEVQQGPPLTSLVDGTSAVVAQMPPPPAPVDD